MKHHCSRMAKILKFQSMDGNIDVVTLDSTTFSYRKKFENKDSQSQESTFMSSNNFKKESLLTKTNNTSTPLEQTQIFNIGSELVSECFNETEELQNNMSNIFYLYLIS